VTPNNAASVILIFMMCPLYTAELKFRPTK
jgi:hypothetical protein